MNTQKNLRKNILNKINKGDLKMKPKIYFTARTLIIWTIISVTVVTMAFFVSFSIFSIRESSRLFLLGFGSMGVWTFFVTFPWFLLVLEIILLIVVDILLKHFKFAYKTPFIYLILSTAIFVMFISIFISSTPIHETLYQEVIEQRLPALDIIYKDAKQPPIKEGVLRGIITRVDDDMFTIYSDDKDKDKDDGLWDIFISQGQLKYISSTINVGDFVVTACRQKADGRCYLYGLKILDLPKMK